MIHISLYREGELERDYKIIAAVGKKWRAY